MEKFNINEKVGDIVTRFPKAADIFKEYQIDFCCGGDKTLKSVAKDKNINETDIIDKINALHEQIKNKENEPNKDFIHMPLGELCDYIVNRYHAYLYENLPKTGELLTTILRVHGENHPELLDAYKLFFTLKTDMEAHLIKEETIQYPAIKRYEKDKNEADLEKAMGVADELANEHMDTGKILRQLRKVTNNYTIPDDACETYKLAYTKMKEIESDIFEHVHLENNILFPRILELKESNNK